MKSIKEKSNEYTKEYLFSSLPQRAPNIHFEAGANYVLEQLEEFQKLFSTSMTAYARGYLKSLIEQLKK